MPEFRPLFSVRKGGSSLSRVSTRRAIRRSEKPARTAIPRATWSRAIASACAWKFPPLTLVPSGKMSGLSVAAFISIRSEAAAASSVARTAPRTCGMHRNVYGSCTLCGPRWDGMISLPRRRRRRFAATSRAPGWDHRVDAAVQEVQEARHEDPTDAGVAHRQRVGPKEDRRADLVATQRRALPDCMAPQQVELERPDVRVGDFDVREFAEARLDSVSEGALRDDLLEGSTARVHALRRGRGQAHRFAVAGHRDHVIEVQGPAIDRTHGGPARHPGSAI